MGACRGIDEWGPLEQDLSPVFKQKSARTRGYKPLLVANTPQAPSRTDAQLVESMYLLRGAQNRVSILILLVMLYIEKVFHQDDGCDSVSNMTYSMNMLLVALIGSTLVLIIIAIQSLLKVQPTTINYQYSCWGWWMAECWLANEATCGAIPFMRL